MRADGPPPIVLIVADDLGVSEIGPYRAAGDDVTTPRIPTPALDALATRSTRFRYAYSAAPVCAPSRCSFLTGLDNAHCAVRANVHPNRPLDASRPTFVEALASAGYRTAIFGKWGLGGELDDGRPFHTQSAPWRVGFDEVFATLDQVRANDHSPAWYWMRHGASFDDLGLPSASRIDVGPSDTRDDEARFVDELLAYLREVDEDQPFFAYFASTFPHRELDAPTTLLDGVDPTWPLPEQAYATMVRRLDTDVGRIVEALESRGLFDRTLFLFTSDNGPVSIDGHLASFFGDRSLRGEKRDLFEGGLRIPLLVHFPGQERPIVRDEPVVLTDLARTLVPDGVTACFDDRPRWDLPIDDRSLYFGAHESRSSEGLAPRSAMRDERFKWIRFRDGSQQLFDLSEDPGETHDLAAADVERARTMRRAAREHDRRPIVTEPRLAISFTQGDDHWELVPPPDDAASPILSIDERGWEALAHGVFVDPGDPALPVRRIDDGAGSIEAGELTPARGIHYVVPTHPSLALGAESFSVLTRVALHSTAHAATADQRQWLLFHKALGLHDSHAGYGVLLQGGDFDREDIDPGTRLAVFFGDPELDERGSYAVTSRLGIRDHATHEVVVVVDRTARVVRFRVDDEIDEQPLPTRDMVASEAPLFLGVHHGASGAFQQRLHGRVQALEIARGATDVRAAPLTLTRSIAALPRAHTLAVDDPSAPIALTLENVGGAFMDVEVEWSNDEVASFLLAGGDRRRIEGPPGATTVEVRALRGRLATSVWGAPMRLTLVERAPMVPVVSAFGALVASLALWALRRTGRRVD